MAPADAGKLVIPCVLAEQRLHQADRLAVFLVDESADALHQRQCNLTGQLVSHICHRPQTVHHSRQGLVIGGNGEGQGGVGVPERGARPLGSRCSLGT